MDDKPKENCGVVGIYSLSGTNVIPMIIDALRALQHRGQEAWGLAIPNKPPLKRDRTGFCMHHLNLKKLQRIFIFLCNWTCSLFYYG